MDNPYSEVDLTGKTTEEDKRYKEDALLANETEAVYENPEIRQESANYIQTNSYASPTETRFKPTDDTSIPSSNKTSSQGEVSPKSTPTQLQPNLLSSVDIEASEEDGKLPFPQILIFFRKTDRRNIATSEQRIRVEETS